MKKRAHRGFMTLDLLGGLMLIMVVSTVAAVTVTQRYRTAAKLADSREAARLAENTLIKLRAANAVEPTSSDVKITPGEAFDPSSQLQWATVTATYNGRSSTLVGLIRRHP